jgi:prepilin-type N-terminal cleavage/methylation domain-containing protein
LELNRRRGLTLVELLVVLLILSILTVVAVQSTDTLLEQGRFDSTQRTLQGIEEAIIGASNQREPDGTFLVTGFVADVGRLPQPVGTDALTQLQELWTNPNNLKGFDFHAAPFDAQVMVPGGWRGPYLRLPTASSQLRDGWGNPFTLQFVGAPATAISAASLGADHTAGGTGYNLDTAIAITPDRYLAGVVGNVKWLNSSLMPPQLVNPDPANGTVVVKIYGPNPADPTGVGMLSPTPVTGMDGSVTFQQAGVPIGPRVVRAYQMTNPADPMTITKRSQILRVMLRPGGGPLPDLILQ